MKEVFKEKEGDLSNPFLKSNDAFNLIKQQLEEGRNVDMIIFQLLLRVDQVDDEAILGKFFKFAEKNIEKFKNLNISRTIDFLKLNKIDKKIVENFLKFVKSLVNWRIASDIEFDPSEISSLLPFAKTLRINFSKIKIKLLKNKYEMLKLAGDLFKFGMSSDEIDD